MTDKMPTGDATPPTRSPHGHTMDGRPLRPAPFPPPVQSTPNPLPHDRLEPAPRPGETMRRALLAPDPDPRLAWRDEVIEDLRDVRDRVTALHTRTADGACQTCGTTWPCPTSRELGRDYRSARP